MPFSLYGIGLIAVPVLLSLTLHEYGHARTAQAFGDHTARLLGRCSLNPLRHLDPIGTLCFLFGPVGWAKPVPVDHARLRPPRLGDIAVSLAGVGMNAGLFLASAIGLTVMAAAGVTVPKDARPTPGGVAAFMLSYAMIINVTLAVFNLIPLYPLDGHHVVREVLPWNLRDRFMAFQVHYGRHLLMFLIIAPWLLRHLKVHSTFDPIGIFMGAVVYRAIGLVLPHQGLVLFFDALKCFSAFRPY